MQFEISGQFFENSQILNFMKVLSVGIELFHANGRTDRHDEANSRFSQFCEKRLKIHLMQLYVCCLNFVLH